MSPNSEALHKLLAPKANYDDIPTINVANHEVPLPAYWRIIELLELGKKEEGVVNLIVREGGFKTQGAARNIVKSIADNQRQLDEGATAAAATKSNRLSTFLSQKSKRISVYRAARLEAHRDLEAAESRLHDANNQEKLLLHSALELARKKEKLNEASPDKMSEEVRRKTVSEIDHEIKMLLQRHAEIETQIEYAKRLKIIHKASLA